MSDEPNQNPNPNPNPLPNDPAARTPDGTLKNPNDPNPNPDPTPDPDPKKEEAPQGAPEKYETFTLPEGLELAPETVEKASAVFKEMNLSQEAAQKLVDFHAAELKAALEGPLKTYTDLRESWTNEVKADKTLSDGTDLRPEVRSTMAKAIDSLGVKEAADFREALNITGVGDNPAFVRGFYAFAKQLGEGTHVSGGGPAKSGQSSNGSGTKSAAQSMWPNLPSNG